MNCLDYKALGMQFKWLITRLQSIWSQRNNKAADLPDDVIVEILSRLPADEVLRCRRVCRTWRTLTSTPFFAEKHLQHSLIPTVFGHYKSFSLEDDLFFGLYDSYSFNLKDYSNFFLLDESSKKKVVEGFCAGISMNELVESNPTFVDSCNGLLLFKLRPGARGVFYVCNPITDEVIRFNQPFQDEGGYLFGFFFHSLKKEYKILYVLCNGNEYYIFTLGGPMQWRSLGTFAHLPKRYSNFPVKLNQTLHWIADYHEVEAMIPPHENSMIIQFNTMTEEFSALPCPAADKECIHCQWHPKIQLLDMDGQLSCWCVCPETSAIHGWVSLSSDECNTSTTWGWTKMFKVDLDSIKKHYSLYREAIHCYDMDLVNFQNNELLLAWSNRGLFRYNLETNGVREIEFSRIKKLDFPKKCHFISFTKSLVCLRCLYGGCGHGESNAMSFY